MNFRLMPEDGAHSRIMQVQVIQYSMTRVWNHWDRK